MDLEILKFPIGQYEPDKSPSKEILNDWIKTIEEFPAHIEKVIETLSSKQLNWRYRPDGWNIIQVVHHCADSHMNALIRFKLTLTEDQPAIRPYFEDRWAELSDYKKENLAGAIEIIKAVHKRMVLLFQSLTGDQLQREYIHPEHGKKFNLAETIGNYAWHSNHHLAHIKNSIKFEGEFN